jgi:addiction module HigA family antidote
MMMHNPPHPGETLREDVLPALDVGIAEAADGLGVSRQTLSAVLNGRQAITPEMAARIEAWLGAENGGRAEVWLAQQAAFDLWQVRQVKADALTGISRSVAVASALVREAAVDAMKKARKERVLAPKGSLIVYAKRSVTTAHATPATARAKPHAARKAARKAKTERA